MSKRIIINGAAGTGKTTLGAKLAKRLELNHMDLDDYYYHRNTEVPFSSSPSREEIRKRVMNDILVQPDFVMSGTIGSILWDLVNPLLDMAVILTVPCEIRMERIRTRENSMFGTRILPGGDMYESSQRFLKECEGYDTGEPPSVCLKRHKLWASELLCPVFWLDGTKAISDNVDWISARFLQLPSDE